jgi:opacity protein-like surface antigen
MIQKIAATAVAAALFISTATFAQSPQAQSGLNNNAVNSPGQNNSNAPIEGRNSFTEGQAKSRIEAAGYTEVSGLAKDDAGVWRGKASKGGSVKDVSLDFQGNVNPN